MFFIDFSEIFLFSSRIISFLNGQTPVSKKQGAGGSSAPCSVFPIEVIGLRGRTEAL